MNHKPNSEDTNYFLTAINLRSTKKIIFQEFLTEQLPRLILHQRLRNYRKCFENTME